MSVIIGADNGTISGSGGLKITGDSSGIVQLTSGANTAAVTIDSSQRVGIGTVSPSYILDVGTTATTNTLRVNGTASVAILNGTSFGQVISPTTALYLDAGSGQPVVFRPNGSTEAARFTSAGNLSFNTSNAGIVFDNSSASTNSTLNDYETGTWTPVLTRISSAPTITYSNQYGAYTKIGNLVYITIFISFTANSGGSGGYKITGLPFTSNTNSLSYPQMTFGDFSGFTFAAGTQLSLEIYPNQTYGIFFTSGSSSGGGGGTLVTTASAAGQFAITGTYQATF